MTRKLTRRDVEEALMRAGGQCNYTATRPGHDGYLYCLLRRSHAGAHVNPEAPAGAAWMPERERVRGMR